MATRSFAAPPTPWSKSLAEPKIEESAYVHSFSNIIGDVYIGNNVLVAPSTSIRADEGSPFHIGSGTNIQDGVVIHGLEKGRVSGDDRQEYSVWIGENASITHMALIHGPAYVGDNAFIGFRSTVFNAKVGAGCIVMMHALVQDVEIPPGKFVPSGSIITSQQQVDRLANASETDIHFANHVVGINDALRTGYHCAEDIACISTFRDQLNETYKSSENQTQFGNMQVSSDVISQVRQLIAQGFSVSTEHADERRFKTKSWYSDAPLSGHNEVQMMDALQARLAEYAGEYVRIVGVDPKAKKRVLEVVVQRPGDKPVTASSSSGNGFSYEVVSPVASDRAPSSSNIQGDIATQVRQLISQGHRIGIEHADERRFRTNSWYSGSTIDALSESQALNSIQSALAEYPGEYVRLIGIDKKSKRRVLETIIQRPNGKAPVKFANSSNSASAPTGNGGQSSLGGDVSTRVRQLISQGLRIGIEHADERRFRTNSWYSSASIDAVNEAQALTSIQSALAEYTGEYVRLIGIDKKSKRRVSEAIIQRPNGKTVVSSASGAGFSSSATAQSTPTNGHVTSTKISSDVLQQIRSLIAQGHKVGTEHADHRRFRTNSWYTCSPIESNNESQVVAALETCLNEHSGEYVRLLGIDVKAKKRVLETVIQRP